VETALGAGDADVGAADIDDPALAFPDLSSACNKRPTFPASWFLDATADGLIEDLLCANAKQGKARPPLMSDCSDDPPTGIVPRDRSAAARTIEANQRRTPGDPFPTSIGRSDAALPCICLHRATQSATSRAVMPNHASTRLKPLE